MTSQPARRLDKAPLLNEVKHELGRWELSTPLWGGIYVVVAAITIVFPLIIAAQETLASTVLAGLAASSPILALLVAIAAGIEQAVKPRLRWREYTRDRQEARALRTEIEGLDGPSDAEIDRWRQDWKRIQDRHGKNLP